MPNTLDDFYSEEESGSELQSPLFIRVAPPPGAPFIGRDGEDRPIAVASGFEPNITHVDFGRRRPSRGHRGIALLLVSLLAATGWGAFFYEVARPTDGALRRDVTADKTPAVNLAGIGLPDRPIAPEPAITAAAPAGPERPSVSSTTLAPATKSTTAAIPSPNISGSWQFATAIDGAERSYDIELQQTGDSLTGTGRNGSTQAPIALTGTISGNRLTLTFSEADARGKFVLLREADGKLHGRFASSTSQSPGIVEAHRKD